MGNRHRVQCPLALAAKTFEGVLHEFDPPLTTDRLRAVRAVGVHDDDIIRPAKRVETEWKMQLLIQCEDQHRCRWQPCL